MSSHKTHTDDENNSWLLHCHNFQIRLNISTNAQRLTVSQQHNQNWVGREICVVSSIDIFFLDSLFPADRRQVHRLDIAAQHLLLAPVEIVVGNERATREWRENRMWRGKWSALVGMNAELSRSLMTMNSISWRLTVTIGAYVFGRKFFHFRWLSFLNVFDFQIYCAAMIVSSAFSMMKELEPIVGENRLFFISNSFIACTTMHVLEQARKSVRWRLLQREGWRSGENSVFTGSMLCSHQTRFSR